MDSVGLLQSAGTAASAAPVLLLSFFGIIATEALFNSCFRSCNEYNAKRIETQIDERESWTSHIPDRWTRRMEDSTQMALSPNRMASAGANTQYHLKTKPEERKGYHHSV